MTNEELPVVVVLTGFADIFRQFQTFADFHEPEADKIAVTSRGVRIDLDRAECSRWTLAEGVDPFIFARNANIGMELAGRRDVFLVNDDAIFTQAYSLRDLRIAAYSCPHIGLLSPQFFGQVGNKLQMQRHGKPYLTYSSERLAFTGIYIKRGLIDKIGYLDEQFDGYGSEDDDYCLRARQAGYRLAITNKVLMRHGFGRHNATASFARTMGVVKPSSWEMAARFRDKWQGKAATPNLNPSVKPPRVAQASFPEVG